MSTNTTITNKDLTKIHSWITVLKDNESIPFKVKLDLANFASETRDKVLNYQKLQESILLKLGSKKVVNPDKTVSYSFPEDFKESEGEKLEEELKNLGDLTVEVSLPSINPTLLENSTGITIDVLVGLKLLLK